MKHWTWIGDERRTDIKELNTDNSPWLLSYGLVDGYIDASFFKALRNNRTGETITLR